MAAFFFLLAVIIGVVVGDATIANTGSSSVTLFNRWTITRFTDGELLLIAAVLGFLCALLPFAAFGASRGRRMRRKERRGARRDLEARIAELERDNADLRQELSRRETSEPGVPVASRSELPTPGPRADTR